MSPRFLFRLGVVGVAYYVTARLGLGLSLVGHSVTPLWPPTGVAVVALLAAGFRVWPAISIAAFAVNLPISPSVGAAAAIAAGNTLAPLAAAWALRRLGFRTELGHLRDAVALVGVALVAMTISASVGTAALRLSDAIPSSQLAVSWWVWWTGDAMGVLIVAPFLWSLRRPQLEGIRLRRVAETVGLYVAVGGAATWAGLSPNPQLIVVVPPLVWAAWRYQQRGAAPAAFLASLIVILAAVDDRGVFADRTLVNKMIVLQSFNAVVSFTGFFLAAAVTQRRRASQLVYEREHRVAQTLQRTLLPELPAIPGVEVGARYISASGDAEVGGDWYDAFPMTEGRVGLVVGDVAGHGISATAAMAQLRTVLRADATMINGPGEALDRLNWVINELHPELITTLLYAQLDPASGEVRFARAGHPPPLVIGHAGDAVFVESGLGPPLGVHAVSAYEEATCLVEPHGALLLFTDGLVERRDESLDARLEMLRRVASLPVVDVDVACDRIVAALLPDGVDDDVALLAVRPSPGGDGSRAGNGSEVRGVQPGTSRVAR